MKKLSVFLYTLALGSAFYSCSTAKQDTPQTDYTQYVDPFIVGYGTSAFHAYIDNE
jgi:hypothetical protein